MFIIFHAGAGRDVSLPGSIGLERDLPSIYLSESALKNIYGDSFKGFPVNNGSFNITNSAILPETESRELSIIGGTTLIELSINGLIVADIASYLGLPDLFDTESGKSAIGRFGLMDGQAIFAYGGLFPPALSAWEKIYLGWREVSPARFSGNYGLLSPNGIIKIPINANEYFLIENRERDVLGDGARLTVWQNGVTTQKTFPKDQDGFYSFDISALQGVVTSVDEYDWALPGSGIVIWHIDEKVINEKLKSNTINVDKNRRGVDVEEADGIQDIGEEFNTIFGDVVIGEGDSVDLWYKSNPSELFTNRFDNNSKPNTNSNEGGSSLVTISDFSDPGMTMTFSVNFAADNLEKFTSAVLPDSSVSDYLVYSNSDSILTFYNAGRTFEQSIIFGASKIIGNAAEYTPAIFGRGNDVFIASSYQSKMQLSIKTNAGDDFIIVANLDRFTSYPVWNFNESGNVLNLYCGTASGNIEKYEFNKSWDEYIYEVSSENFFKDSLANIALSDDYLIVSSRNILKNNFGDAQTFETKIIKIGLTQRKSGEYVSVVLTEKGNLYLTDEKLNPKLLSDNSGAFAIGNLKNDAENHIIFYANDKIFSVSLTGSVDDGFPFINIFGLNFDGTPLIGELNGDKYQDIVAADIDGNIFAIDGSSGRVIPPFPISTGSSLLADISMFNNSLASPAVNGIAIPGSSKVVNFWNLNGGSVGEFSWSSKYGNLSNTNYLPAPKSGNLITEFFPQSKVYNWPNPVYGGETNIHFYVSENSEVDINIFDLSGNLVQTLSASATGGFENEIKWNTSGIESGVYFAHVNVKSSSGKNDLKIIKIAVIH